MHKLLFLFLIVLVGCSETSLKNYREINSIKDLENDSNLNIIGWHFETFFLSGLNYVYTPFFVEGDNLNMFSGGAGAKPNNGLLLIKTKIKANNTSEYKKVIKSGPDLENYNYFRAPRVAKFQNEMWMIVELSGCYSGCDSEQFPKSFGVYLSNDSGNSWKFLDFMYVDGKREIAKWFAHTGLIYNPNGSKDLNLIDISKNKFITIGEDRNILISNDGIHYKSVSINYPFPNDRFVFASIAKTPYGFHLMTNSNWNDSYFTSSVRHLFSKDLINWIPLESSSILKNPNFYKGVHLSYSEKDNKLWAISPCGTEKACSIVAWMYAKDFSNISKLQSDQDFISNGEYVYYKNKTAMVIDHTQDNSEITYKLRFYNGEIDSGFTKEMLTFPLKDYKRQGCEYKSKSSLCIGDGVYFKGNFGTIIGIKKTWFQVNYAIKFSNGYVDTGYLPEMIDIPKR